MGTSQRSKFEFTIFSCVPVLLCKLCREELEVENYQVEYVHSTQYAVTGIRAIQML